MHLSNYVSVTRSNDSIVLHNSRSGNAIEISSDEYEELCIFLEKPDYLLNQEIYNLAVDNDIIFEDDKDVCPKKIKFTFQISEKCNLLCKHCCNSATMLGKQLEDDELDELVNLIISASPTVVTLTGGEPMLHPRFREIVSRFKNKGISLTLMTNGTFINESNADFLASNLSSIDISLDGYDEETTSKVRGQGVFQKVMVAVSLLKKYNLPISLSMCFTRETVNDKEKFIALCKKLDVRPLVRGLALIGRAKDNEDILKYDSKFYLKSEIDKAINFARKKAGEVDVSSMDYMTCDGAFSSFYITYNGDIYPCPSLERKEYLIGNLFDVSNPKEFFFSRQYIDTTEYKNMLDLFPTKNKECCKCNWSSVCVTCPAECLENFRGTIRCETNRKSLDIMFRS